MSRKLIYLMSFILVLGMTAVSPAGLDDDPALEGWWQFDGDASDSSAKGRDAELVGDAHLVDVGLHGGALSLDGSGDYAIVPSYTGINADRTDPDNPFNPACSIAFWVKTTDASGAFVTWGSSDGTGVGGQRQSFRINAGRLRAEHGNGNLQGATTINDGEWHHIVQTTEPGAEGGALRPPDTLLYLDGAEETYQGGGSANIFNLTEDNVVNMGNDGSSGGRLLAGELDDVRIYSRVLDPNEIAELAIRPKSYAADPAVGALVEDVSILLGWSPGGHAVEHDVYFGATAELGADQLLGRQAETSVLAADLQKDTTYYWRVDDVAADGTVVTGDTWSFWVPPRSSYDPSIEDGSKILGASANLSWTAGFSPIMHQVYFGTDADQVANAADAPLVADIGHDTGELQPDTTYYWRVDEFYGTETVTGQVWSFSTVPVLPVTDDPNLVALWTFDGDSGGVALDQSGNGNHVALKNGAQVAAGHGGDVLDLGAEGYGAVANLTYETTDIPEITVSAWIRTDVETDQYVASFDRNEYWRLEINGNGAGDGQVGWDLFSSDGQLDYGSVTRVDDAEWHHVTGVFDNGTATIYIDGFAEPSVTTGATFGTGNLRYGLIAANSEATSFDGSNSGGPPLAGEMDDLAIYDRAFTEDEMRQLYGNLLMAWQPQPAIGDSGDIWSMTTLSWTPGDGATEHFIYLGTDPDAVAAADVLDTTGIYRGFQSEASYVIPEKLDFDTNYYWRVDERALSGGIVGLTTGRVWPFSTEAELVIYDTETPFDYDTSVDPFMSDISLDLDPALDLTEPIGRLAVSYTGNAAPGSVTVDDAAGTVTVVGRGADIWGTADEFQYAYTTLTGDGSMTVKVDSLASTDNWTKAGIMIRESLDAGSAFAAVYATGTNGVRFQARMMTDQDAVSDTSVATDEQKAAAAPVWIMIERVFPMINAYYSTDGVMFVPMSWNPQVIPMTPAPIHIGLAVTSHSGAETFAEAVFSEVSSTGGVAAGPLTSAEIGLASNSAEPMYLVLTDASGATAALLNPDPAATQQTSATDFTVVLQIPHLLFAVDLTAVAKVSLVIGDLDAPAPGGSGSLTINNVRLLGIEKPVGHWTLDETSGTTAADSSGNGNDGTLNGDPVWATGIVAGALEFDGVDDYVDCGNPAILDPGTGDFTISAWIKGSVDPGTDTLIFSKGGDSGGGIRYELMLRDNNNGDIKVLVDDDNDKYDPSSETVGLLDGAWHHIVGMRRNGTELRVYIDGVEDMGVTTHSESTIPETYDLSGASQANAHIGANWHNEDLVVQKFFLGLIDDVRVYDRALSEGEIAKLVAGL
ncbi:MAG: hypothetical protein CEE38_00185 [Planctomycetes bacterium B3_Pla]|nr:MAG: hypothetical protein CEE38_00185 [Planctomycetes bacterium B3_Pla]